MQRATEAACWEQLQRHRREGESRCFFFQPEFVLKEVTSSKLSSPPHSPTKDRKEDAEESVEEKDKMASNLEEDKTDEVNKEQQDMVNDEKKDGKVANEKDDEVK